MTEQPNAAPKGRVLIVEDEFIIAAEMEAMLTDCGYECVGVADDVKSAKSLAQDVPDVALIDVNLSDGATGPDIGEYLSREYGTTIVFVTANPRQVTVAREGMLGVVSKPLEIGLVCDAVSYALARREGRAHPTPPAGFIPLSAH